MGGAGDAVYLVRHLSQRIIKKSIRWKQKQRGKNRPFNNISYPHRGRDHFLRTLLPFHLLCLINAAILKTIKIIVNSNSQIMARLRYWQGCRIALHNYLPSYWGQYLYRPIVQVHPDWIPQSDPNPLEWLP